MDNLPEHGNSKDKNVWLIYETVNPDEIIFKLKEMINILEDQKCPV